MNRWSKKGFPDGDWGVINSSTAVQYNEGVFPTFFVSDIDLINVKVSGKISVIDPRDDDFVGIVMGFVQPVASANNNNYGFYLFDWKSKGEQVAGYNASEGFRLSHYNGFIQDSDFGVYFYNPSDLPPERDLINKDYGEGKGWRYYEEYLIELEYTQDQIKIYLDSTIIFEHNGCTQLGKFGFYTMSQPSVRFEGFTYENISLMHQSSDTVCHGKGISFYPYNPQCGNVPDHVSTVNWDFGDGEFSSEMTPEHFYSAPGDYQVTLIVNEGSECADTLIDYVTILEMPVVDLGDDQIIPVCSTLEFDAGNDGASYLWSTGETTKDITLSEISVDTTVWAMADKMGCIDSDTVNISVVNPQTRLFIPNAFTPNNDGENDKFLPVGANQFITDYNIKIFNRWGQLLFESSDPLEGWDGNYNNEQCPVATYTYSMVYRSETCNSDRNETVNGTVTLIR